MVWDLFSGYCVLFLTIELEHRYLGEVVVVQVVGMLADYGIEETRFTHSVRRITLWHAMKDEHKV